MVYGYGTNNKTEINLGLAVSILLPILIICILLVIIGNMNFPPPFQATTKILISLATYYRAFPIFLLMKNFCLPILIGFVGVHITNYFLDLYCVSQHRFITHRIS